MHETFPQQVRITKFYQQLHLELCVLTESGLTRSADSEGEVKGGRGVSPRMRWAEQGRSKLVDEVEVAHEGGWLAPPFKGASGLYQAVEMDAVRLEPTEINVGDITGHVVTAEVEHQMGGMGWEVLDLTSGELPLQERPQYRGGGDGDGGGGAVGRNHFRHQQDL